MKVYIVSGEPSGDLLASGMMDALLRTCPTVEFRGIGGESMAGLGFTSLFDIEEISVMGVFEVLPNLLHILRRIKETVDDILRWQPDVLVTVDSWGFVEQLVSKLRKQKITFPVVHYVAPQVWAWKKGRAKKVARLVDRLMMLLPDEGQYFEKYGLRCDFVGHPVVERVAEATYNTDAFRKEMGITPDATVICVLSGSRRSEVKRLMPIFEKALARIKETYGDYSIIIPTVSGVERTIIKYLSKAGLDAKVITGQENRYNAFRISRTALAASGTVSLELAAVGIPHLIAYRFNAITDLLVRIVIKIPYANLLNLRAGKEIIPEFVLQRCRPELIASCAIELLQNPETGKRQVAAAQNELHYLRLPDILSSDRAAQIVLEMGGGCSK